VFSHFSNYANFVNFFEDTSMREVSWLGEKVAHAVYEHSAIGMAVCALDGRFISVNAAMCGFLGYSESELLERTFMDVTHPDDVEENVSKREALLANSCDAFQLEKRYLHKSGEVRWALTVVSVVRDAAGKPLFTIGQMLDIGALKHTELALRANRESLADAQRLAHLGDWEWHIPSGRLTWSDEVYRIFGIDKASTEPSYALFLDCVHPEDRAAVNAAAIAAVNTGGYYETDHRICRPDGTIRVVHELGTVYQDAEGNSERMHGTVQDITDRYNHEQAARDYQNRIQQLAAHETQSIEAERKRIAQEIHDDIGQLLTVLKIDMLLSRAAFADNAAAQANTDAMLELLERTIGAVRQVTHNLRPPALNFGLVAALEWLVQDISRCSLLSIVLDCARNTVSIEDRVATAAFRIAQESLTNIMRHADATEARIAVEYAHDSLILEISDNGCGFDVERGLAGGGFGLLGMRERIAALDGRFDIESGPDRGTVVRVVLPVSSC
jgi:PAS domain S-box-containing protein